MKMFKKNMMQLNSSWKYANYLKIHNLSQDLVTWRHPMLLV